MVWIFPDRLERSNLNAVGGIDKESTVRIIARDQVAASMFIFARFNRPVLVIVCLRHVRMIKVVGVPLVTEEHLPGHHTNDARANVRRRDGKIGNHGCNVLVTIKDWMIVLESQQAVWVVYFVDRDPSRIYNGPAARDLL